MKPIPETTKQLATGVPNLGQNGHTMAMIDSLHEAGHPLAEHLQNMVATEREPAWSMRPRFWDDSPMDGQEGTGEITTAPVTQVPKLGGIQIRFQAGLDGEPVILTHRHVGSPQEFSPDLKTYLSIAHHLGMHKNNVRRLAEYFKTPVNKRPRIGDTRMHDANVKLARQIEPHSLAYEEDPAYGFAQFQTPGGTRMRVRASPLNSWTKTKKLHLPEDSDVHTFEFSAGGSYKPTGKGEHMQVMGKIGAMLLNHLKVRRPDVMHFSGSDDSQRKLYRYLAKNIGRHNPDYVGHDFGDDGEGSQHFGLIHKDYVPQLPKEAVKLARPSENAKAIKWSGHPEGVLEAHFVTPSRRKFEVQIHRKVNPTVGHHSSFKFYDDEGDAHATGNGEAHHVFKQVAEHFLDHLKTHQPDMVSFTGDGESRQKLYAGLASRIQKFNPNYRGEEVEPGRYVVKRVEPVAKLARGTDSATRELNSANNDVRVKLAHKVLMEGGLRGRVFPALSISDQDSRASTFQQIHHSGEPDAVRYLAAWYGLLAKEPKLTVFHVGQNGPDTLHMLTTQVAPDVMLNAARTLGINQMVKRGGQYIILDKGNQLTSSIARLKDHYNATVSRYPGTSEQLGSSTGASSTASAADARTSYRNTIKHYESATQAGKADGQSPTGQP